MVVCRTVVLSCIISYDLVKFCLRLHVLCSISDEDDIINALWIGFLLLQELLVVYNQFINQ